LEHRLYKVNIACRQLFILVIFSQPSITSYAESLPQHRHLHHSDFDRSAMGILSDLHQSIPKFQKLHPYHSRSWHLFDDVDGFIDNTALAYQYRQDTTS